MITTPEDSACAGGGSQPQCWSGARLDTGTFESMVAASQFVRVIEARQGYKIGCIGEIAWRIGWIDEERLLALAGPVVESGYGDYLERLVRTERKRLNR